MRIEKLLQYDFPEDMVMNWKRMGISDLQSIQEQAIQQYKLFNGNSMIVSAPTSSGKTFVGELAAVYQAIKKRKTAFLVPLKAIAEEKFLTFKQMYERQGIRVVVSSRDRKEFDTDIENGAYEIAIIVYEKFFQLLNSNEHFLDSLGLVVIDELQMLADSGRGATLEMILTHLRMQKNAPQIVGLSAVLGNNQIVNQWLGIDLLQFNQRPIELRLGYIYQGVFHYRSMNNRSTGDEIILSDPPEEKNEILYAAVEKFAHDGEQSLLFLLDKDTVRNCARELAARLPLDPATDAINELTLLEDTFSRDDLTELLRFGVAYHHADLTPEERELVERHFRNRSIKVLVSTTTLAMGVNLPTRNVFLDLERWKSEPGYRKPFRGDITKAEFENMGGRAGRYNMGDEYGRGIAIAHTPLLREQIRYAYLEGQLENIKPNLWRDSMATTVLGIVSLGGCESLEQMRMFLRNTLSWYVHASEKKNQQELDGDLDKGITLCLRSGAITESSDGAIKISAFGKAVVNFGIRVETASKLRQWIEQRGDGTIQPFESVLFSALTVDGLDGYLTLSTPDYKKLSYHYQGLLRDQLGATHHDLFRAICEDQFDDYESTKLAKTALMLADYLGTLSNKEIEKQYKVYFGTVKRVAEQISWVISAAAGLIKPLGKPDAWRLVLDRIALQVQFGVPDRGVFLAQLRLPRLGRERIRRLVAEGISSEQDTVEAGVDFLAKRITRPLAIALLERIEEMKLARERAENESKSTQKYESPLSNVLFTGNNNIMVVGSGSFVIHHASKENAVDANNPCNLDDFSGLPLTTWVREVTQRLNSLSSDHLNNLFTETRAFRHNRIQAAKDSTKAVRTTQELIEISKRLQTDYQTYCQMLTEKFQAIILPSYDSDFATLSKSRQVIDTQRISFIGILDGVLKSTTRIYNLLKTYKTSPEALLLEAVELCRPVMNGTVIDNSGLIPTLDRNERFYPKQVVVEAFSNLLRNAESSLLDVESPRIDLMSRIEEDHPVVTIQDNGCGIPVEKQSEIFKDGYSTKGTDGFGLAHTKQTIEAIGGTVRLVTTKQMQGATFEVVL